MRPPFCSGIASAGAWDPSNDWSITGVNTTPGGTPALVQRIPLYDNGVRVFGNEPGGSTPDTQPPSVTLIEALRYFVEIAHARDIEPGFRHRDDNC